MAVISLMRAPVAWQVPSTDVAALAGHGGLCVDFSTSSNQGTNKQDMTSQALLLLPGSSKPPASIAAQRGVW